MNGNKQRELLLARLTEGRDEAFGLTASKFNERGRIVTDPNFPGKIVFEVERHQAIAGSTYTRGLPMAAYQTCIVKYVFDPIKKGIEEVERRPIECSIDPGALARDTPDNWPICVVRLEGKTPRFRIEAQGLFEEEVSTFTEAKSRVEKEIRSLDFRTEIELLEGEPGIDVDEQEAKIREAAVEKAVADLEDCWSHPEVE